MAQFILEPLDEDPFAQAPVTPVQAKGVTTLPNGYTIEHLDENPFRANIDFSQPDEAVRAEIGKLKPGSNKRKLALQEWSDARVKRDRAAMEKAGTFGLMPGPGSRPLKMAVQDTGRNMARGLPVAGPFLPEITAKVQGAIHGASGGKLYAPEEETLAYEDAYNRHLDKDNPVGSTVAKLVGGGLVLGPLAKGILGMAGGLPTKSLASSAVGGGYAYTGGFGESRADTIAERHQAGLEHAPVGAGVGLFLPGGLRGLSAAGGYVADKVTPGLARLNANMGRFGIHASGDETSAGTAAGAWAAALQMAANQLRRAGRTEADINAQLEKMGQAFELHSSGKAQDMRALVDLDPALADLVAHAARMDPGAKNTTNRFFKTRQTGHTPETGEELWMGLPSRERMGPTLTGKETKASRADTDYGAGLENPVPMGQAERITEAQRRAFLLMDKKWHGHEGTAAATDASLARAQKLESDAAYGATRKAGDGVNLNDPVNYPARNVGPRGPKPGEETFGDVTERWLRTALDDSSLLPPPVRREIARQITALFKPKGTLIHNIGTFDEAKQYLDAVINRWGKVGQQGTLGINKRMAGVLAKMRDEMIDAVDRIETNGLGGLYKGARDQHAAASQARKYIKMGREARDNPNAIAEFGAITNKEGQKLYRLGFIDDGRRRMAELPHGHDKSKLFDSPKMDELMRALLPRTEGEAAAFSNRPQRWGRFLDNERRMSRETPQNVVGGSPTQKNAQIDAQFQVMDRMEQARDLWMSGGSSMVMAGFRFLQGALNKIFGMKADTAKAVARQLLTADPTRRAVILNDILKRMDPDRFTRFLAALEAHQQQLLATTARQTTQPTLQAAE